MEPITLLTVLVAAGVLTSLAWLLALFAISAIAAIIDNLRA